MVNIDELYMFLNMPGCWQHVQVWTYATRVAFVLSVTAKGEPIRDDVKLQRLRQMLLNIMSSDGRGTVISRKVGVCPTRRIAPGPHGHPPALCVIVQQASICYRDGKPAFRQFTVTRLLPASCVSKGSAVAEFPLLAAIFRALTATAALVAGTGRGAPRQAPAPAHAGRGSAPLRRHCRRLFEPRRQLWRGGHLHLRHRVQQYYRVFLPAAGRQPV